MIIGQAQVEKSYFEKKIVVKFSKMATIASRWRPNRQL